MGNLVLRKSHTDSRRIIYPSTAEKFAKEKLKFADNAVRTQKYSILTFIPKNLYEQFHRFANIYFVFILILNFLPQIQAFGKEVAPIPVIFVLSVTAIKDAVEDFRRYKSDKKVNHSKCLVYSSDFDSYEETEWKRVVCGDFIKLNANETIPADVVLLHSGDKSGICHIETSNLDGETNLKQREVVLPELNNNFHPKLLKDSYFEIESPNKEIYKFNGTICRPSTSTYTPMKKNNLLLRGCTLRNTDEVIGLVVYAGKETKAMLNNNDTRFKRSKLERQINKDVIWCVLLLIILCLSCAIGNVAFRSTHLFASDYIEFFKFPVDLPAFLETPAMQAFITFWTCVIYYQAMIPLPLYVTFELVKMHQVFHIRQDLEMFDEETGKGLEVRAFNIPEDLGQIQYVFCDKTGTLTENRMQFKRAFIHGVDYIDKGCSGDDILSTNEGDNATFHDGEVPEKRDPNKDENTLENLVFSMKEDKKDCKSNAVDSITVVKDFFLLMAICNTTVVSLNKNETKPVIKAKKPDLRSKIKRHFHMAGEGMIKKAISVSSFSAKPWFIKTGHASIKAFESGDSDLKIHDTIDELNSGSMELKRYERRESARPPLIIEDKTELEKEEILTSPGKSRKVKSVTDFQIYSENCSDSNYLQVDNIPIGDSSGANSELDNSDKIIRKIQMNNSHFPDNVLQDNQSKCPYSDSQLLVSYESESPDEMALVKTACKYGFKLLQRGPGFVTVWNSELSILIQYKVLHILPFDSVRKRMSIIVQCPLSSDVIIFCKGADSTMFNRLNNSSDFRLETHEYIDEYARQGLRTLVLGKRVLEKKFFEDWNRRYQEVDRKIGDNESAMNELMCEIEDDLTLLGVTGIEDCLQDGVPDTIESLRKAGITVWILTGDKRETALNIAYSAKLFCDKQKLINLIADSKEKVHEIIKEHLSQIEFQYPEDIAEIRQGRQRPIIIEDLALCIDGDTLTHAMHADVKMDFLRLAEQCCSVVCARSTPMQKAEIVQLVKENLRMQTLAIGDGANDVSMIQTADVGIGIGGKEGMQAVMASDFSMTKFKFLKRLLLVHGSWCYNKLARTALYMFYKDTIYILVMFWYQFHNAFSASVMIDQITQILFNITMTGLSPIIYGIWDKDLHAETLMNNPQLYRHGINCKTYQPWHFWATILDSVFQSLIIYYFSFLVYMTSDIGIWEFGQIVSGCALVTCIVHMGIETRFWTIFHALGLFISFFLAWLVYLIAYGWVCNSATCNQADFIFQNMRRWPFWLLLVITPAAAILPRLTCIAIWNSLYPNLLSRGLQEERQTGRGKSFNFESGPELVSIRKLSTFRGTLNLFSNRIDHSKLSNNCSSPIRLNHSLSTKPEQTTNKEEHIKHRRVKSYDENIVNTGNVIVQSQQSPLKHEVQSFLSKNAHSQTDPYYQCQQSRTSTDFVSTC